MIKDIYVMEHLIFYYHDEKDHENVEDREIVGYFSNYIKLKKAIELIKNEIGGNELVIKKLKINCSNNQKYLYTIFYEYSFKEKEEYIDYYYYFLPLSNKQKCEVLINDLLKKSDYKFSRKKIYDDKSFNGFTIRKVKINFFSYKGIYKDI